MDSPLRRLPVTATALLSSAQYFEVGVSPAPMRDCVLILTGWFGAEPQTGAQVEEGNHQLL